MSRGGFSRIYIPHCRDEIIPGEVKGAAVVNVKDLLGKYQALFTENKALKEENEILKAHSVIYIHTEEVTQSCAELD